MRVYGYLRASTQEQDATRAKQDLQDFAERQELKVSCWFIENESGATLKRPELFRLLEVADAGDVLLVEQVNRISRLNAKDWESLRNTISDKGLKVVALDLPTSHQFIQPQQDAFTERVLNAINAMMLDMLAAIARKDYEDRRKRQAIGVQRAKQQGKYTGRQPNHALHRKIEALLREGKSYRTINDLIGASNATIAKVKRKIESEEHA